MFKRRPIESLLRSSVIIANLMSQPNIYGQRGRRR
jgi:hypothetical protein